MKAQKKITLLSAATICLLAITLVATILFLRSFDPIDDEENRTTDTWSADFTDDEEKLAFLGEYLIAPGEVLDAEFHIVYHDNSTGLIPGPSDWDVRVALKIKSDELPLWLDGFTKVSSNEVDLSLWNDLSSDTILWNNSSAEYYRREGDFSYLVAFSESDVILKAASSMAYPPMISDSGDTKVADDPKYPGMVNTENGSFTVVRQNYDYTDAVSDISIHVEYLQLTGLADTEKQERINTALYEIVDILKFDEESELELTNYSDAVSTAYSVIGADIISVQYATYYDHMMAAHPSAGMEAVTINLQTGEKLKLSDILILNDNFSQILNAEIAVETRMEEGVLDFYEDAFIELHESIIEGYSEHGSYYLTENAIGFILYVPHVVGDYWTFEIAYNDILDWLTPDFQSVLSNSK